MDLLYRILTVRNIALFMALAASFHLTRRYVYNPYHPLLLSRYQRWRYPEQKGTTAIGSEIMARKERLAARRVANKHARVGALLEQARREGFQVGGLQAKADAALKINVPEYRNAALRMLGEVEMAVPRKKTALVSTNPPDEEGIAPDVQPSRKPEPKSGKKRSRRPR